MPSYAETVVDDRFCTHSIDNLIVEYTCMTYSTQRVLDDLSAIFQQYVPNWSRARSCISDLLPSQKYCYYKNVIWGDGFNVYYGHYQDFDKITREWFEYPLLRVKFNPNKHWDKPVRAPLMEWIAEHCSDGLIIKMDYAVDVPCPISDLVVHSRKEPGLFKGTRYFGQRNKHGRLKVYDKKAESDLPDDSTRVEWTLCSGKPFVFDDVLWLTHGPDPLPDAGGINPQTKSLILILLDLRAAGGDVERSLSRLDNRTRKKIEPYTLGSGVQLMSCTALDCLADLVKRYCSLMSVAFSSGGVNPIVCGSPVLRRSHDDLEHDELPF